MNGVVAGVLLTASALVVVGCAPTPPSQDGRISVLAAFYPLQYAAQRVGGDRVSVESLTPPGVEPHDVELSPQQVAEISQADLIVYIKGFQPAVDEAVAQEAGDRALDVTEGIPLLPADSGLTVSDGAPSEHDPTNGVDPHVWLNPMNMVTISDHIAGRLAAVAPDHERGFVADAARFATQLRRLDRQWSRGTRDCASRDLVVSHDAFGYLAQRYGFRQIGISGMSPEAEPSPTTIAAVAGFVQQNDVTTVYYETLVDPKVARTVADEVGVATAVLDPIEGIPEGSGATYLTAMRSNLTTVRPGQGCS